MLLRLVTLLAAQLFDLATFGVMVGRHGVAAEANPTVGNLFVELGMPAVALLKILLIVAVGALAVAAWARGGRGAWMLVGVAPIAIAIIAGVFGGYTNAVAYLG